MGARDGEEENVLANPSAGASGVTSAYRFDNARVDQVISADAGLRARGVDERRPLDFCTPYGCSKGVSITLSTVWALRQLVPKLVNSSAIRVSRLMAG